MYPALGGRIVHQSSKQGREEATGRANGPHILGCSLNFDVDWCIQALWRLCACLHLVPRGPGNPNMSTRDYLNYRNAVNSRADEGWMGLIALLHRAYWKRVWIVQEVLLSRQPVLCFGRHRLAFRPFSRLIQTLSEGGNLFRDMRMEFQVVILALLRTFPSFLPLNIIKWPPRQMAESPRQYATWLLVDGGRFDTVIDMMKKPLQGTAVVAAELGKLGSRHLDGRDVDLLQVLLEARIRESSEDRDRVYAMLGLTPGPWL